MARSTKRGEILNAIRRAIGLPVAQRGDGFSFNPGYGATKEAEKILVWITAAQALITEGATVDVKTSKRIHGSRTPDRKGERGK